MLEAHLAWSISRGKDEVYELQKYEVTLAGNRDRSEIL